MWAEVKRVTRAGNQSAESLATKANLGVFGGATAHARNSSSVSEILRQIIFGEQVRNAICKHPIEFILNVHNKIFHSPTNHSFKANANALN